MDKVLSTTRGFNSEIENINKDFKNLKDRINKIRSVEKRMDEILVNREKIIDKAINKDIER